MNEQICQLVHQFSPTGWYITNPQPTGYGSGYPTSFIVGGRNVITGWNPVLGRINYDYKG